MGKPVEIIFADHQNKADVGMAVARRWFETASVDMAIGFDNSAVALAVEQLAADHNRIVIAGDGREHCLYRQGMHADRGILGPR